MKLMKTLKMTRSKRYVSMFTLLALLMYTFLPYLSIASSIVPDSPTDAFAVGLYVEGNDNHKNDELFGSSGLIGPYGSITQVKFNNPSIGTYTQDGIEIEVYDADDSDEGVNYHLDFTSSNYDIAFVFVKAGDGGFLYSYDPKVNWDNGLDSPKNDSISHVSFYVYVPTPSPDLSIVKEAWVGEEEYSEPVMEGTQIDYYVTITNTGNVNLEGLFTDNKLENGDEVDVDEEDDSVIYDDGIEYSLIPGGIVVYHYSKVYFVGDSDSPMSVTNIATATSGDIEKSDSVTVQVIKENPGATLVKKAYVGGDLVELDDEFPLGTLVKYQVTITNTGNVDLEMLFEDDGIENGALVAAIDKDPVENHTYNNGFYFDLPVGEKVIFEYSLIPDTFNEDDEYINTAYAYFMNYQIENPLQDSETVKFYEPEIPNPLAELEKLGYDEEGNLITGPIPYGDSVTYKVTVENTGDVALDLHFSDNKILSNMTVTDINTNPDTTHSYVVGDGFDFTLAIGQIAIFEYTITPPDPSDDDEETEGDQFINTASIHSVESQSIYEEDDFTINLFEPDPDLEITKSAKEGDALLTVDSIVQPGSDVDYTVVIKNTGNIPLDDLMFVDSNLNEGDEVVWVLPGDDITLTYGEDGIEFDNVEVYEEIVLTYTLTINEPNIRETDLYDNLAEAFIDEYKIDEEDNVQFHIREYSILLEKSVSPDTIYTGQSVTYTFVVTNTSLYPLYDVEITDEDIDYEMFVGDLAVGESKTYTVDKVLTTGYRNDGLDFDNIAQVIGYTAPLLEGESQDIDYVQSRSSVDSDDDATVTIRTIPRNNDPKPDIELVKSVDDDEITFGESVVYTLVVTNTGENQLEVNLVDEMLGIDEDFTLGVNESETFTESYEPLELGNITNTATAYGTSQYGNVSDTDKVTINVTEEDIPQGPPEILEELIPESAPEVLVEEEVPLDAPMPKTNELPAYLFYGMGSVISGLGIFLRKRD
jgi:hypothetical protein